MTEFDEVRFGQAYEEPSPQPVRSIYFFIKKKESKLLYVYVTHHKYVDISVNFEIVTKKFWYEEDPKYHKFTNLFIFLEPSKNSLNSQRDVIAEVFMSTTDEKNKAWSSLLRSLRHF